MKVCFLIFFAILAQLSVAEQPYPLVKIQTRIGFITFELYPDDAPITVENFLGYVNTGFYDMTLFHRLAFNSSPPYSPFVLQGGGFIWQNGVPVYKTPHSAIINESSNGLSNLNHTIAMARTGDPNSATSQFFINYGDNTFLDKSENSFGYAVFGKVVGNKRAVDWLSKLNVTSYYSGYGVSELPYYSDNQVVKMYEVKEQPRTHWYRADVNFDGFVDLFDFAVMAENYGESQPYHWADINTDNTVNLSEIQIFSEQFLWSSVWYRWFRGDINTDHKVDLTDFARFALHWRLHDRESEADLDQNREVDFVDLSIFTEDWLSTVQ